MNLQNWFYSSYNHPILERRLMKCVKSGRNAYKSMYKSKSRYDFIFVFKNIPYICLPLYLKWWTNMLGSQKFRMAVLGWISGWKDTWWKTKLEIQTRGGFRRHHYRKCARHRGTPWFSLASFTSPQLSLLGSSMLSHCGSRIQLTFICLSFIQMLKALMPVPVYSIGILFKKDSYKNNTMMNMVAISVGVAIAA